MFGLAGCVDGSEPSFQGFGDQVGSMLFFPGCAVEHRGEWLHSYLNNLIIRNGLNQVRFQQKQHKPAMSSSSPYLPRSPPLETLLISNALPLPPHFNGHDWNTTIPRTRKAMPQYLQEDLPPLKYHYIRQQFKDMNKIQCPRLTYFQNKIVKIKQSKQTRHSQGCSHRNKQSGSVRRKQAMGVGGKTEDGRSGKKRDSVVVSLQGQLTHIKKSLQYALLTSEKSSNVITQLIEQGNNIEEQLYYRNMQNRKKSPKKFNREFSQFRGKKSQRSSFREELREDSCFGGTIQLVIEARKEDLRQKIKEQTEKKASERTKGRDIQEQASIKEEESIAKQSQNNDIVLNPSQKAQKRPSSQQLRGVTDHLTSIVRKIGEIELLPYSKEGQIGTEIGKLRDGHGQIRARGKKGGPRGSNNPKSMGSI